MYCTKEEICETVCIFQFLGKTLLEIKKQQQNTTERTLPYCQLKVLFKSPSKLTSTFILKMCSLKNSAIAPLIVLSVKAVTLFLTAKQNQLIKSAISDHLLTYIFTILSKDSNNLNLLIKES